MGVVDSRHVEVCSSTFRSGSMALHFGSRYGVMFGYLSIGVSYVCGLAWRSFGRYLSRSLSREAPVRIRSRGSVGFSWMDAFIFSAFV